MTNVSFYNSGRIVSHSCESCRYDFPRHDVSFNSVECLQGKLARDNARHLTIDGDSLL